MRLPSWLKIGFIVICLFVISVLALEILLRLTPEPRFASNWVYDPVVGHHGPKNTLVPHLIENQTKYNSYGYRGENPTPLEYRNNIFSIALLGDSFSEAILNPWRRSFAKRLEFLLDSSLNRDVEVTNWAYSDYSTTQEFLVYDLWAKHTKPNLVLLQFLGINDYINNGIYFAEANKALGDFVRPYMAPATGEFPMQKQFYDIPITYLHPWQKYWMEHSRIYHTFNALMHIREWNVKNTFLNSEDGLKGCEVELEVFLDEQSPAWANAYESTYRIARALKESVHDGGADLAAVYFPSFYETFPLVWERSFVPKLHRCYPGKSFRQDNPERRFLEIFQKAGVKTFSLKHSFEQAHNSMLDLYLPDGHLSSEGHRVTAQAIHDYLVHEKLVPFSRPKP